MNPEVDQFMPRRLQQEHDKGNHANPATESDSKHQQANCPGCRKEAAEDNGYDLRAKVYVDHIYDMHEDAPHSGCDLCYPHGERHNASLTTLPAPQKPVGNHPVAHVINHVAMSHDGSEPGCPLCERWGTNWVFPNKNI